MTKKMMKSSTNFSDMNTKKRVAVGMSGGVDSSVAAALLVKEGYDCVGMTMKLWYHKPTNGCEDRGNLCCSLESVEAARKVARDLGIDYFVLNVEEKFKKEIVEDFVNSYAKGETPNPCVKCNEMIKFGHFDEKASSLNAEYIATGHYARTLNSSCGRTLLLKAKDSKKDQSYMLYRLSQEQLKKALFPLGDMFKEQVREYAASIGIEAANKPDSQEVCFIPYDDYRRFLIEYRNDLGTKGEIIDAKGKVLGMHNGIAMYTIGQRKGLGALADNPMYVTDILPKENRIVVGGIESTYTKELKASCINLIAIDEIKSDITVEAKIRYRSTPKKARLIQVGKDEIRLEFAENQSSITPGQSVVFYDGEIVIGGGIIQRI